MKNLFDFYPGDLVESNDGLPTRRHLILSVTDELLVTFRIAYDNEDESEIIVFDKIEIHELKQRGRAYALLQR